MLPTVGLDAAAEAVYRAMLGHPDEGVGELAARLGIAEGEVRAALDLLSGLALVRPASDRPASVRAASPDIGMEVLLSRQYAELALQQRRLEEARASAARLISDYADLDPQASHPGVEQLVGLDRVRDRLVALTRATREEVMTFAPDGAHTPESIRAARPLNADLLERGVRIRTIYLDSVQNSPHTAQYVEWLSGRGGQVRTVPSLPTRMIITDRSSAVIPVRSDNSGFGAVVLTGQGMLTALCSLFDTMWTSARPLGQPAVPDAFGLTVQEAAVVRFLAEGHTDQAIGNRLGVSQRTARRMATDLMERLGARSRFEFGVQAVRNGWLPAGT